MGLQIPIEEGLDENRSVKSGDKFKQTIRSASSFVCMAVAKVFPRQPPFPVARAEWRAAARVPSSRPVLTSLGRVSASTALTAAA